MLFLTGIAAVAVAVFLGGNALGLAPTAHFRAAGYRVVLGVGDGQFADRAIYLGVALGVFLLGLLLMRLAVHNPARDKIVLTRTKIGRALGGGEVAISRRGLRAIAAHNAQKTKGVYEAFTDVSLHRRGWHVDLRIVLAPHAALPDVLSDMKTALYESLYHHTGLPVHKLRVYAQMDPLSKQRRVY